MKKKPVNVKKALSFDKETIAKLNEDQLDQIAGGGSNTCSCNGGAAAQEAAIDIDINSCVACSCRG